MSENSSRRLPIVLAAAAAIGLLVVLLNGDEGRKTPVKSDVEAAAVTKDGRGAGDAATDGARRGDVPRDAATEGARQAGGSVLDGIAEEGWFDEDGGLGSSAYKVLRTRMMEDSELPAEEMGWHEADGERPTPVGSWCGLKFGAEGTRKGFLKTVLPSRGDVHVGTVKDLGSEQERSWAFEERWDDKKVCTRTAATGTPLPDEWTCGAIARLTDRYVSLVFEDKARGAETWMRCDP